LGTLMFIKHAYASESEKCFQTQFRNGPVNSSWEGCQR
jgi:hypothetical protein